MTDTNTSVHKGVNATLIAKAAALWIPPGAMVLDVTFGRGKFWAGLEWVPAAQWWRHPAGYTVVAHDLANDGVDFRRLPEGDESVDVVVYDPPYIAPGGLQTSTVDEFNNAYGLTYCPATATGLDRLIVHGMVEAVRVLRHKGRLFVKCKDYVTGGKFHRGHKLVIDAATLLGLDQVDEYVHHAGTGPQRKTNLDGTPRKQYHARSAHSFLCIFEKGKK